jgi:hypothetical protein
VIPARGVSRVSSRLVDGLWGLNLLDGTDLDEEAVGRELGDSTPAFVALFQVLPDTLGKSFVELAQTVGLEDRAGWME